MRRHMVWFTAALCAGIGIAAWGSFAFGSCYGAAAGTLIAAFLLLRNRYLWRAGLLCLVAACGCVAYSLGNTPASDSLRRMLAFHPDRLYTVSGTIDSVPVRRNDYGFCRLLLEAVHAHGQRFSCRGRISLKLSPRYLCSVGDRVRLKGLVKLSQPSCISVRAPGSLQVTGFNPRYLVRRAAARIKEGMRRIIMRRTREVTARLLSAMMLGDRHQVPLRVKRSLARCGTAHVLVISGFHVGVIAFVCLVLQKA
ncbi:MAG: ComEC family competence protein, partial [Candidatus Omnitrophica bacterium]|nr:ComEC family competence protein [Candidatus Omnitrophota bacterium]